MSFDAEESRATLAPDVGRATPSRATEPGGPVVLGIGTCTIEPSNRSWVTFSAEHTDGSSANALVQATWQRNDGIYS